MRKNRAKEKDEEENLEVIREKYKNESLKSVEIDFGLCRTMLNTNLEYLLRHKGLFLYKTPLRSWSAMLW